MYDREKNADAAGLRENLQDAHGPIILIAGTGSGVGKTSMTLALIRALVRSGRTVQPFKVGPDFLDPTYLALAAGRTCYNLDTWMCGGEYVVSLVAAKRKEIDVVVIEGVMGLFDGASPDGVEGSAAEVARLIDASVLLVCDASGQAGSLAATVKGFVEFVPGVRIAGVLANRVGSASHTQLLARALQTRHLPPLLGGIENGAFPKFESRHLGLVAAQCSARIEVEMDASADAFSSRISLEQVLGAADGAFACEGKKQPPTHLPERREIRLGIAKDAAFSFYYRDNLDAFEAAGFELVLFSPIEDCELPFGLDALFIGGGYPELWAEDLEKNETMRASIRSFCHSDRPVYTECGGLMYLCRGIVLTDGAFHAMTGFLPGVCRMQTKLQALGYAEIVLKDDAVFGAAGTSLKGHTFHYSSLDDSRFADEGWRTVYDVRLSGGRTVLQEGYCKGNVLSSYVHLHLASHPDAVRYFRDFCLKRIGRVGSEI